MRHKNLGNVLWTIGKPILLLLKIWAFDTTIGGKKWTYSPLELIQVHLGDSKVDWKKVLQCGEDSFHITACWTTSTSPLPACCSFSINALESLSRHLRVGSWKTYWDLSTDRKADQYVCGCFELLALNFVLQEFKGCSKVGVELIYL